MLSIEPDLVLSNDAETRSNDVVGDEGFIGNDMLEKNEEEEPPILPREIVRRKLDNKYGTRGKLRDNKASKEEA